jgi:hypothetical protein
MSNQKRFLIAGAGAIGPLLVNLTVLDLRTLFLGITALVLISYVIRQAALFAIGGVVGLLNKEDDALKLFQIGIAAPALLTALLNANQVRLPSVSAPPAPSSSSGPTGALISSAYAQETPRQQLRTFSLPQESATQQVYRGLFGSVPTNVWYVIAGSYLRQDNAEQEAQKIRQKGFAAEVYAPYGANKFYAVVIGAQLTRSDAQQLRQKAIQAGLPRDTYLWTFATEAE